MAAIGLIIIGAGIVTAAIAIVLYRRKVAAWYSLRLLGMILMVLGLILVFNIPVSGKNGNPVHL